MDTVAVLQLVPFLAKLGATELAELGLRARTRTLEKGDAIFEAGDPALGLVVVASGAVKVTQMSENGREQVLTIEGPGSSVAEVPLFDGGPYPASAIALEPSEVIIVPRADFFQLLRKHPEIAVAVVEEIGRRLRQLVLLVEELSLKEVGQRLARFLLDHAGTAGSGPADGATFQLNLTNQEIAARIGTVRELVSRGLRRLKSARILALEGRRVTLLDVASLEAEAESSK